MKIISFAWTTDALLARRKTVTRRSWSLAHARRFGGGEIVQAWDHIPSAGGKKIGEIMLTQPPYLSNEYPEEDYGREGLAWMEEQGILIRGKSPRQFWEEWKAEAPSLWVVRFQIKSVET